MSTLCQGCSFDYQQGLLKTFPGPGYLCSKNGVVYIYANHPATITNVAKQTSKSNTTKMTAFANLISVDFLLSYQVVQHKKIKFMKTKNFMLQS